MLGKNNNHFKDNCFFHFNRILEEENKTEDHLTSTNGSSSDHVCDFDSLALQCFLNNVVSYDIMIFLSIWSIHGMQRFNFFWYYITDPAADWSQVTYWLIFKVTYNQSTVWSFEDIALVHIMNRWLW